MATICHLLHTLNVGGAEVLAARLARQLSSKFRFVFACLDDLGSLGVQLRHEGFVVEVLQRRPGVDFGCMSRLREFWRRQKVEMVHAHQYTPFFYATAARTFGRPPPVLFTEHGRWFPDYPRRKRILFNRLMLRRSDRVVGVGAAVREALIRNEGLAPNRVAVIHNGVDLTTFNADSSVRSSIRSDLDVLPEHFAVFQVARLDHLKDHLTAIRTVERVARQQPNIRLLLVGEGPEQATIAREIRKRGLSDQVRLLGLREDVAKILQAADLFLLTSVSEGIPVTVLEAMATGLAVVATGVGGVPEVVVSGITGLLAPAGDDAALAEAILHVLENPAARQQMGSLGRQRVADLFSQQRMHSLYCRLYEEMLCG
jgi:L-malate glycosyltransferase